MKFFFVPMWIRKKWYKLSFSSSYHFCQIHRKKNSEKNLKRLRFIFVIYWTDLWNNYLYVIFFYLQSWYYYCIRFNVWTRNNYLCVIFLNLIAIICFYVTLFTSWNRMSFDNVFTSLTEFRSKMWSFFQMTIFHDDHFSWWSFFEMIIFSDDHF